MARDSSCPWRPVGPDGPRRAARTSRYAPGRGHHPRRNWHFPLHSPPARLRHRAARLPPPRRSPFARGPPRDAPQAPPMRCFHGRSRCPASRRPPRPTGSVLPAGLGGFRLKPCPLTSARGPSLHGVRRRESAKTNLCVAITCGITSPATRQEAECWSWRLPGRLLDGITGAHHPWLAAPNRAHTGSLSRGGRGNAAPGCPGPDVHRRSSCAPASVARPELFRWVVDDYELVADQRPQPVGRVGRSLRRPGASPSHDHRASTPAARPVRMFRTAACNGIKERARPVSAFRADRHEGVPYPPNVNPARNRPGRGTLARRSARSSLAPVRRWTARRVR